MSTSPKKASPTKVVTGQVRLSYVNLLRPRAQEEGKDPKYSCAVLIPKTDKDTVAKIHAAVKVAAENGKELFGGKIPPNLKTPLRDGDTERDDEAYAGHWFLNASSFDKPGLVDENVQEVLDPSMVYSGTYARVSLNFYPYSQKGNRGVGAGLQNVQLLPGGAALSGRSRPSDDFSAVDEDFLVW